MAHPERGPDGDPEGQPAGEGRGIHRHAEHAVHVQDEAEAPAGRRRRSVLHPRPEPVHPVRPLRPHLPGSPRRGGDRVREPRHREPGLDRRRRRYPQGGMPVLRRLRGSLSDGRASRPRPDSVGGPRETDPAVPERLSRGHPHSAVRGPDRRGPVPGSPAGHSRHRPIPLRTRLRVPPPLREGVPSLRARRGNCDPRTQEVRGAGGHRRVEVHHSHDARDRQEDRRHRVRPGRPDLRVVPAPAGAQRDGVRGRPESRRQPARQHPALPADRRSARPGNPEHRGDRRRDQNRHARGIAGQAF